MSYAKTNPIFEFDIYKSKIDNSWNLFISVFRWSFAIQLSKPEITNYDDYLGGNYASHEEHLTVEQLEEEKWLKEFSESVEGEEHLDDDKEYHELEGLYVNVENGNFREVEIVDGLAFITYEEWGLYSDRVVHSAVKYHIDNGEWQKVISL
jgi:hypothetical protein